METSHLGLSNGPIHKGLSKFGVVEVHLGYKKKKSPLTVTLVSQQEGGW